MPFPGYPLDTSKTNATPTTADHPTHHNSLAAAANDLQAQVDALDLEDADLQTQINTKVAKAGDTMTGNLTMGGSTVVVAATAPSSGSHLTNKTYCDLKLTEATAATTYLPRSGAVGMLGNLDMNANDIVDLPASPSVGSAAACKTYVDDVRDDCVAVTGDTMVGNLLFTGVPDANAGNNGIALWDQGQATIVSLGTIGVTSPTLLIGRYGTAANDTGRFVSFQRGASIIGTINIADSTHVGYGTTSDERQKVRDGDANGAAERVQRLGGKAFTGRWIGDDGQPQGVPRVLLYAHDIADEAPYAVVGERGAVDEDGNPAYQQVAYGELVALLFAGLAQALDRVDALEAASANQ